VLASVLCLIPLLLLCRELKLDRGETAAAVGLLSVNSYVLFYAHHLRMYSLLMLLSLVSLWLVARLLRRRGRGWWELWCLLLVNLAMVYTQYYGWVLVGIESAVVLVWRRELWKRFLLQAAVIGLAFLPWAMVAARSIEAKGGLEENLGWISRPSLGDFGYFYVEVLGIGRLPVHSWPLVMVVLGLIVGVAVWKKQHRHALLVVFAVLPAAVAFLVSYILPESIWGHRHLIVCAAPFLIGCVVAARQVPYRYVRGGVFLMVIAWMTYSVRVNLSRTDLKLHWDALVTQMIEREESSGDRVVLYSLDPYLHYSVWFYLEMWKEERPEMMRLRVPAAETARLAERARAMEIVEKAKLEQVSGAAWVAYSDLYWKRQQSPMELLERRGCRTGRPLSIRDQYQRISVFPVECGETGITAEAAEEKQNKLGAP
ncbi:MAG: hypothetical protein GY953_03525, partial [bacterium]|nr:hypothetical protein [bacterium]